MAERIRAVERLCAVLVVGTGDFAGSMDQRFGWSVPRVERYSTARATARTNGAASGSVRRTVSAMSRPTTTSAT